MNEFSMILRDALVNEPHIELAVRMLNKGLTRKEFIQIMADRIRGEVKDSYNYGSEENTSYDKLIGAVLRRVDFEGIAAILYIEAAETRK